MIGVLPIRSFSGAKRRLTAVVDAPVLTQLVEEMAARVVEAVGSVVDDMTVVTSDPHVRVWAQDRGVVVTDDPGSLDAAAALAPSHGERWLVCHADLPLIEKDDVEAVLAAAASTGTALAPSHDGGTNIVCSMGSFRFAYGPGSFHRHLASRPDAAVVVRTGTALDLDQPTTLSAIASLDRGRWVAELLEVP